MKRNEFQNKLHRMSDSDLLSYYYGINDRIKDIDNRIKMQERADYSEHDHFMSQIPFMIGGRGYSLVQKSKLVLKELNKRNISP